MKNRLLYFCLILLSMFVNSSFGAPVDIWFEKANSYYEKENYDSAVVYYQKIFDAGVHNSDVFYNLGNAYFRLNKLGFALLNYEKAKKFSPTDPEIIANLRFAQMNIVDRIPEPKRTFAESVLWQLHTIISLNLQMWILLALLFFICLSFTVGLFASRNIRLWLIYTASLCIIISGLFCFSIGKKIYDAEKMELAIVLEKSVDAKNQPDGSKILFTVHEGTKFQIRKTKGNWSFVSLPNGVSGWVESSSLGHI